MRVIDSPFSVMLALLFLLFLSVSKQIGEAANLNSQQNTKTYLFKIADELLSIIFTEYNTAGAIPIAMFTCKILFELGVQHGFFQKFLEGKYQCPGISALPFHEEMLQLEGFNYFASYNSETDGAQSTPFALESLLLTQSGLNQRLHDKLILALFDLPSKCTSFAKCYPTSFLNSLSRQRGLQIFLKARHDFPDLKCVSFCALECLPKLFNY